MKTPEIPNPLKCFLAKPLNGSYVSLRWWHDRGDF